MREDIGKVLCSSFVDLDDLQEPEIEDLGDDEATVENAFNQIGFGAEEEEEEVEEGEEMEDWEVDEAPKRPKRENDVLSKNFLKMGYITCVSLIESSSPKNMGGLTMMCDRDKNIQQCLEELTEEYGDMLGLADMDPATRLAICTGMLAAQCYSANRAKTAPPPQVPPPSTASSEEPTLPIP